MYGWWLVVVDVVAFVVGVGGVVRWCCCVCIVCCLVGVVWCWLLYVVLSCVYRVAVLLCVV